MTSRISTGHTESESDRPADTRDRCAQLNEQEGKYDLGGLPSHRLRVVRDDPASTLGGREQAWRRTEGRIAGAERAATGLLR
jgi:hypothetical protein